MATSAPRAAARNAAAASAEAPPSSRKMLYLVIALATIIVVGGVAGWYFLIYSKPAPGTEVAIKVAPPPVFLPLDIFTVNLQTDGGDQFLQVALTLQVRDQAQIDQLKLYMPEVRNRLLLLLSSKRAADILTVEGKQKLADEVVASLQQPFVAGGQPQAVSRVFFTSFVIQ